MTTATWQHPWLEQQLTPASEAGNYTRPQQKAALGRCSCCEISLSSCSASAAKPPSPVVTWPKQLEVVTARSCGIGWDEQWLFLEPTAVSRKLQKQWGSFHTMGPSAGQHHDSGMKSPPSEPCQRLEQTCQCGLGT